jgi:uncharacterized protein (TIGR02118 family)
MQAALKISNLTGKTKWFATGPAQSAFPLYFPYSMAQLLALYHQPADPAAFDRYYFETHVPLAKKIPGLRSYVVNDGPVNTIAGSPAPHFIAELSFDSMADLQAALSSAEGRAAAGDLSNFAQAGVTLMVFETKTA